MCGTTVALDISNAGVLGYVVDERGDAFGVNGFQRLQEDERYRLVEIVASTPERKHSSCRTYACVGSWSAADDKCTNTLDNRKASDRG